MKRLLAMSLLLTLAACGQESSTSSAKGFPGFQGRPEVAIPAVTLKDINWETTPAVSFLGLTPDRQSASVGFQREDRGYNGVLNVFNFVLTSREIGFHLQGATNAEGTQAVLRVDQRPVDGALVVITITQTSEGLYKLVREITTLLSDATSTEVLLEDASLSLPIE